jgi:hypothetical protein
MFPDYNSAGRNLHNFVTFWFSVKHSNFAMELFMHSLFSFNTSSRSMAPVLTQPLTEMSTRNRPGGQSATGL